MKGDLFVSIIIGLLVHYALSLLWATALLRFLPNAPVGISFVLGLIPPIVSIYTALWYYQRSLKKR